MPRRDARPSVASALPSGLCRRGLLATALVLLSILPAPAQARVLYFQQGDIYAYRTNLLKLVLAKTADTEGPAEALPLGVPVTTSRGLEMLQQGAVDVASLGTTRELEAKFLPVRIDILRGLLGYRIFLINAGRQADFSGLRSLDELRRLKAGFGAQWGDLAILEENRLPVEAVANPANLLPMLAGGRMDYFPRGINEAWVEFEHNRETYPNLAVEKHLALCYPFPVYFFVRKGNAALAARLERGLRQALADGSFKELFLRYHKDVLARTHLSTRRIFRLVNATLPAGTPEVDTSWWLGRNRP
jgi:hypothetical protein